MLSLLLVGVLAVGPVRLELPEQLSLEAVALEELAPGAAVSWEGLGPSFQPVVVRRLPRAFRLIVPRGEPLPSLEVRLASKGQLRSPQSAKPLLAKATLLPLRWVASTPEGEVYEADVLLHLDVGQASAGSFAGTLEVWVVGR